MPRQDYTLDPQRLWRGEEAWEMPLALIELADSCRFPADPVLPPCPVIGLGDASHPLSFILDCIVEPPVNAALLIRQVEANPHAAAVLVQLLRLLPGLDVEQALTAESMAYGLLQGSAGHRAWIAGRDAAALAQSPGEIAVSRMENRLTVTLDRASHGNAIDRAMRDGLRQAFALAALDPDVEQVTLQANGRTFSLGAELSEFGTTSDPATAHAIRARTLPARMAASVASKLHVHVQGGCVGAGLEIAAFARRITASPDAWFQLPELAMGILPGAGGCVSLSRRIGRQRTALMVLSGKRIGVKQALAWGLVDAIVDQPPGDQSGSDIRGR